MHSSPKATGPFHVRIYPASWGNVLTSNFHIKFTQKTSKQYAMAAPGITEIYFSSLNIPFTVVVMMCIQ